ncbi:uncharacterized protein LOC104908131 [Beta vulgaris subsp. vulgaris]|uniref:uncharacterized protein LOC104908131 n=1 Tax=Beta vulgaris subsp. vulgaris TaxID=3555 RepID=UPI00053FAF32|nr:uncharacterized protein LOC104908131 [Beta vulgaris subsp. vulgaris]
MDFWAVKELTLDAKLAGEKCLLQINELDELRLNAYDSSRLYKELPKRWHDKKLLRREFSIGGKVLLYNSRLKLFPDEKFKVNGQRLKLYHIRVPVGSMEELYLQPPSSAA